MKKAAAVGLILQVPPHPVGSLLPVEGVSEPRTRRCTAESTTKVLAGSAFFDWV